MHRLSEVVCLAGVLLAGCAYAAAVTVEEQVGKGRCSGRMR